MKTNEQRVKYWEEKLAECAARIIDEQNHMEEIKLAIDLLKKHEVK